MVDRLGQLWGIGVGPGDPELITVKALNCLRRCPVVAFPAGRADRPGMAQTIIAPWLNSDQVQLPLWFPYVQEATTLETAWQQAASQVNLHLTQGQDVVFATEGDASFYSTFTYLAQAVQQQQPDVQVITIPGVCSPLAAAAALGKPLTVQHQRLTILPAMHALDTLETALDQAEVLVLMKVAAVYPQVWEILQKRELLSRSRVVVHISGPSQLIYDDLSNHPRLSLPYFSLLIVHC
ncbi:MAG: precorrin-2 C(20)-methyltransferase [Leptolyngbyaceae cyanobacterium]